MALGILKVRLEIARIGATHPREFTSQRNPT